MTIFCIGFVVLVYVVQGELQRISNVFVLTILTIALNVQFLFCFVFRILGCQVGFFGDNCTQPCRYPSFGEKCQRECDCSRDICDYITGCTSIEGKYTNLVFTI